MKSICDTRGHYYLPIDLPPANGVSWSILPPAPTKLLYCRRCGKTQPLGGSSPSISVGTVTIPTVTTTTWSLLYSSASDFVDLLREDGV